MFRAQIELAKSDEKEKAICIHLRGDQTIKDAYQISNKSGLSRQRWIHMHCIGATPMSVIENWIKEWPNMLFGITSNYFLMEVGHQLPLDRLLLETDSPYFVPKKFCEENIRNPKHPGATGRSKRYPIANPGMVFHAAAQVSTLRGISIDEVISANRRNIQACYGIPKIVQVKLKEIPFETQGGSDLTPIDNTIIEMESKVDWNEWSDGWGDVGVLEEEKEIIKNKSG